MTYYRVLERTLHEISDTDWQAFVANGKSVLFRLWVPTAQPIPSSTQYVRQIAPIITSTTATQAWELVNKTQAQIDAEANDSELQSLRATAISQLQAQDTLTVAQFRALVARVLIALLRRA